MYSISYNIYLVIHIYIYIFNSNNKLIIDRHYSLIFKEEKTPHI